MKLDKNVQRKAFLDLIGWAEGTTTHPATKCGGYDVVAYGMDGKPEIFTDFSTHPFANGRPGKVFNSRGQRTTACGKYQFLVKYWEHYKKQLKLPDFGPDSQDKWAIQLIRERKALEDIDNGHIKSAIRKTSNIWASLPYNQYDQNPKTIDKLLKKFVEFGGVVLD